MFKHFFPVLLFPLILVGAGCATTNEASVDDMAGLAPVEFIDGGYYLELDEALVGWAGEKAIGAGHFGVVSATSGQLVITDGDVVGGEVTVDMTTIKALDIEGDSAKGLEDHLMAEDFFDAAQYPSASFMFTGVEALEGVEGANYRVDGEMTIKDVTEAVSFPAAFVQNDDSIDLVGELMIDRTKFGVNFGSGSVFDDLGDAVINDEFTLTLTLEFELEEEGEEE